MNNELKQIVRFIAVAALLLGGAATAFSQTPNLQWQKTHGGAKQEFGYASAKLNNNLYVHGGDYSRGVAEGSMLLFTNANGDSLYSKIDTTASYCRIRGLAANEDGSFVACGYRSPNSTTFATVFLIKFNQLGGIIWQKDFNTGLTGDAQKVLRLPDGYLLVSQELSTVIKIDLNGNLIYQKSFGNNFTTIFGITPMPDGSYVAVGSSTQGSPATGSVFYRFNYQLLKLLPNGDTVFTKIIGSPTNYEKGNAVVPTADGGVAVAGAYVQAVSQSKRQGQVLKLDSLLKLQWEIKVMPAGGDSDNGCEFFSIQRTVNGSYVVAGQNIQTTFNKSYMARIAPPTTIGGTASINWSQYFTNGAFFRDMLYEDDGSAIIGGTGVTSTNTSNAQVLAVKMSNLGQPYKPDYCAKPPISNYSYLVKPDSIVITNSHKSKAGTRYGVISKWEYLFGDGNSFVTYDSLVAKRVAHKYAFGTQFMYGNPVKLIVTNNTFCTDTLTLYPFGGAPTGITEATAATVEVKLYPNPMQQESILELKNYAGKEKLSLEVTNILGRKVAMPNKQLKANQWQLQRGKLSRGLYVYRLVSAKGVAAQGKILLTD